jgi:hypothetical protein
VATRDAEARLRRQRDRGHLVNLDRTEGFSDTATLSHRSYGIHRKSFSAARSDFDFSPRHLPKLIFQSRQDK